VFSAIQAAYFDHWKDGGPGWGAHCTLLRIRHSTYLRVHLPPPFASQASEALLAMPYISHTLGHTHLLNRKQAMNIALCLRQLKGQYDMTSRSKRQQAQL
jgi:hypothetical protein